jgi:ribosome assembly protein YihI (activator of Der GTPase)
MNQKKPTLEETRRQFEKAFEKTRRELEEEARNRQRKPPGDDEPGSSPPASPLRH